MMREIKFRAWGIDGAIRTPRMFQWDYVKGVLDVWLEDESAVVMQYTGLKDKHGKEIYEGDIVGLQSYSWNEKTNKHDILDKVCNEGVVHIGEFESSTHDMGGGRKSIMTGWLMEDNPLSKHVIILGNMYENPELLGKRNV